MTKLSQSAAKKRITIGKVGGAHGINGEMRIIPLTDFTDRFADMKEVMVGSELLHITSVRYHKQFVLMKFAEYPVREDAMRLTGKKLTIDRSEAAPLNEGEYYTFDIIGLTVFNINGEKLGTIENVLRTGSNDVYQTRLKNGGELLVPALKTVVKLIDVHNGKMVIDMPEELSNAH